MISRTEQSVHYGLQCSLIYVFSCRQEEISGPAALITASLPAAHQLPQESHVGDHANVHGQLIIAIFLLNLGTLPVYPLLVAPDHVLYICSLLYIRTVYYTVP